VKRFETTRAGMLNLRYCIINAGNVQITSWKLNPASEDVKQGLKLKMLRGPNEDLTRGPHYNVDATMALPQPYWKQLLHLISYERYRELQANHF